jgi:hypothetical protein
MSRHNPTAKCAARYALMPSIYPVGMKCKKEEEKGLKITRHTRPPIPPPRTASLIRLTTTTRSQRPVTPALLHLTPRGIPGPRRQWPSPPAPGQPHLEPTTPPGRYLQVLFGGSGRVQVDIEGEDVGRENEGNDPLEHGTRVIVAREGARHEGDGEDDLEDDEDKLDIEGDAEDAVLAVAWIVRVSIRDGERGVGERKTYACPASDTPSK